MIVPARRQRLPVSTVLEHPAAVLATGSTWKTPDVVRAVVPWRTAVVDGMTVNDPQGLEVERLSKVVLSAHGVLAIWAR